MMVRNKTDHSIYAGGSEVPPGETVRVRDDPGVRELIKAGVLVKETASSSSSSSGDNDDKKE